MSKVCAKINCVLTSFYMDPVKRTSPGFSGMMRIEDKLWFVRMVALYKYPLPPAPPGCPGFQHPLLAKMSRRTRTRPSRPLRQARATLEASVRPLWRSTSLNGWTQVAGSSPFWQHMGSSMTSRDLPTLDQHLRAEHEAKMKDPGHIFSLKLERPMLVQLLDNRFQILPRGTILPLYEQHATGRHLETFKDEVILESWSSWDDA